MPATPRFPTLSQLRASDYSHFGQLGWPTGDNAPHPPYQPHTYTTTFNIDP